jgi:hypothetical protein
MRHKLYTIARLVGTGSVLLSVSAWAEPPADRTGEGWDDSHMQSNFSRRASERVPHRVILGSTRYGDATATPPTRVTETILSINPHGWTPGGATVSGSSAPPWAASGSGFSSSQGATPHRSSGLRSSAGSSGSGRRTSSF